MPLEIVFSRVDDIALITSELKIFMSALVSHQCILVFVSQRALAAFERPRRIVQGHVSVEAGFFSESEVAGIASELAFLSRFVGVKMTLKVAHVTEKFSADLAWNRPLDFCVLLHNMQL